MPVKVSLAQLCNGFCFGGLESLDAVLPIGRSAIIIFQRSLCRDQRQLPSGSSRLSSRPLVGDGGVSLCFTKPGGAIDRVPEDFSSGVWVASDG